MADKEEKKYCRFVSEAYHDSFFIEDGGTIFINGNELKVTYTDPYHFMVDISCYHIQEFYEKQVERAGNIVLPGKGLKTREYGNNYKNYEKASFQKVYLPDIGDEPFEYTGFRIPPETLPLGRYVYDLVCEDSDSGYDEWLCKRVWANHFGCVVSKTQIFGPSSIDNRIYLEKGIYHRKEEISANS